VLYLVAPEATADELFFCGVNPLKASSYISYWGEVTCAKRQSEPWLTDEELERAVLVMMVEQVLLSGRQAQANSLRRPHDIYDLGRLTSADESQRGSEHSLRARLLHPSGDTPLHHCVARTCAAHMHGQ
jgi:hypothetical protein